MLVLLFILVVSPTIAQAVPTKPQQAQNAQVYFDKAYSLRQRGQYQEAVEAYKEGLRLNPNSAHYYNQLSYTYSLLKQHEQAIDAAKKALELQPDNS